MHNGQCGHSDGQNGICLLSSSVDSQTTGLNSEYQKKVIREFGVGAQAQEM